MAVFLVGTVGWWVVYTELLQTPNDVTIPGHFNVTLAFVTFIVTIPVPTDDSDGERGSKRCVIPNP